MIVWIMIGITLSIIASIHIRETAREADRIIRNNREETMRHEHHGL